MAKIDQIKKKFKKEFESGTGDQFFEEGKKKFEEQGQTDSQDFLMFKNAFEDVKNNFTPSEPDAPKLDIELNRRQEEKKMEEQPTVESPEEELSGVDLKKSLRDEVREMKNVSHDERKRMQEEISRRAKAGEFSPEEQEEEEIEVIDAPKEEETPTVDEKEEEIAVEGEMTAEQEIQTINKFNEMINAGATSEELINFATQTPQLKNEFAVAYKNNANKAKIQSYTQKYSNASNQQITDGLKSGDIVVGSKKYNALPEGTKKRIQTMQNLQSDSKKTDFNKMQKETSLDDIFKGIKEIFTTDLRKKSSDLLNSPEIKSAQNSLRATAKRIRSIDDEREFLEDDLKKEFPNASQSKINAVMRERLKGINREKRTLMLQYNDELAVLSDLKDDANNEIELFKLEDANNRQAYLTSLNIYNQRRSELRADQKFMLQEENKRLAADRSFENQKELALFNQQIRESDLSGGRYFDNGEGDMVYVKNGQEIKVLTGLGAVVGTSDDANYTYQIRDNEDGTRTVYYLPKKQGLNVTSRTFSVDGEDVTPYIQNTGTGQVTSYGGPHDNNRGLDIDGSVGDPVTTPISGEIVEQMSHKEYGNTVVMKLSDGNTIRFSHLDKTFGSIGDTIPAGSTIGTIGNTGFVKHLDGSLPTAAELKQGFGSHLDIVTQGPSGVFRTAKETEAYLNSLGGVNSKKGIDKSSEEYKLAESVFQGIGDLGDITPTQKAKIIPIINALIDEQLTDDEDRNMIIRSSIKTKDLSESALDKISDMNTVKFQLDNLEKRLKGQNTGPIAGRILEFNSWDTEAQVALAQLAGLTPKVARGIFGEVGVLTDTDIQNYQRALPNLKSTAEKNAAVIDFMRQLLQEGYKNAVVTQAKGGRNVSSFLEDYDEMMKMNYSNKYISVSEPYTSSSGYSYDPSEIRKNQSSFFPGNNND